MSVENSKIRSFLPVRAVLRLGDVQNYGHAILIILPDGALVRAGGITPNQTIGFVWVLSRLIIRELLHHFRNGRVVILTVPDLSWPYIVLFRHYHNLLSHNVVFDSAWRPGFGTWGNYSCRSIHTRTVTSRGWVIWHPFLIIKEPVAKCQPVTINIFSRQRTLQL